MRNLKIVYVLITLLLISCSSTVKHRGLASSKLENNFKIEDLISVIQDDLKNFEAGKANKDHKALQNIVDPQVNVESLLFMVTNPKKLLTLYKENKYQKLYHDFYLNHFHEGGMSSHQDQLLHDMYVEQNRQQVINLFAGNRITNTERKQIVEMITATDVAIGEYLNPGSISNIFDDNEILTDISILNKEIIAEALMAIPKKITGVSYNGDSTRMEYKNKELEKNINLIAYSLYEDKLIFREAFRSVPPAVLAKFRKNSYSGRGAKIEPFDLILDKISGYMYSRFADDFKRKNLDYIPFKRMMKKALVQAFLVNPKDDIYAWQNPNLNVLKSGQDYEYLCANGLLESQSQHEMNIEYTDSNGHLVNETMVQYKKTPKNGVLEYWTLNQSVQEAVSKGLTSYNLNCGSDKFNLRYSIVQDTEVPSPDPFVAKNNSNVLMTVALVDEIGAIQKSLIKKYFTVKQGWKVERDYEQIDTASKFNELFPITDIYFPVSHSMEVNHFMVGAEKSNYLVLSKEFISKDGEVRKTNLHLLIPARTDQFYSSVVLKGSELAQLYSKRRKNGYPSLFLMNLSCGSAQTLQTWTTVYRKSVKLERDTDITKYTDLPYIIGADRGFDTQGFLSIAKLVDFPLGTTRILQTTGDIDQVLSFLKKPSSGSFLSGVKNFLNIKRKNNEYEDEEDKRGFSPVYNLSDKKLMEFGGFRLDVTYLKTGEVTSY